MSQATLFESPLEARWRAFHDAHPEVYELFERFALRALERRGGRRIGARMIWERMRWEASVELPQAPGESWRLNDHHAPYAAREFERRHPELGPVFEKRRVQGGI